MTNKPTRHYVVYRNGSYCFSASNVQAVYQTFQYSEKELKLVDLNSYSKFLRTLRKHGQVTITTDQDQRYVIASQPLYKRRLPTSELLRYA